MIRVVKALTGKRVIPAEAIAVWGPCPTRAGYFPGLRAYLRWIDGEGEDEWDECSHKLTCECESCMQTYPERFDDEWHNIYRIEAQP